MYQPVERYRAIMALLLLQCLWARHFRGLANTGETQEIHKYVSCCQESGIKHHAIKQTKALDEFLLAFAFTDAMVAQWLERTLHEQEVMGSIPSHDTPKSLKLVVMAFPPGA